MDVKSAKIVAILAVVAVVTAGAAAIVLNNNEDDTKKRTYGSERLLVYGNANNDDYYDQDDVDHINQIIDTGKWDKDKYPFADTNNDGAVDKEDVEYLENFLNGGKGRMYYIDHFGNTSYFNYPLGDRNIAVVGSSSSGYHGLVAGQMLGFYDKITAADSSLRTMDETIYPGVSKMRDIGRYNSEDCSTMVDNIIDAGCSVVIGGTYQPMYDALRAVPGEYDHILLYTSAFIASGGPDVVAKIMTMGVLLDCADEARKYAAYYDDMNKYIQDSVKNLEEKSFVIAYQSNMTTTFVDTIGSDPSRWCGDTWMLAHHLPLNDVAEHKGSGFYEVENETIMSNWDPDVLFIVVSGNTEIEAEKAKMMFQERADYFKNSRAYKNGMVFGAYFGVIGTALGAGQLALLSSYIWPGSFDEDKGWDMLQESFDNNLINHVDVRKSGYTYLFRLNK